MHVNMITASLDTETRSMYRVTEFGDHRASLYTLKDCSSLTISADSPATLHAHFSKLTQAIEASAVEAACQWMLGVRRIGRASLKG